jgi:hypothetical protein
LKAGKYQVGVEKGAMGKEDEFKNAFKGEKSPLTVEIPSAGNANVEIDLDKMTVTAK